MRKVVYVVVLRGYAFRFFFFFNDTATTEIYTLSLHDALPIRPIGSWRQCPTSSLVNQSLPRRGSTYCDPSARSEEHTSELQSRQYLVCRLLLEKKKKNINKHRIRTKKKKKQQK